MVYWQYWHKVAVAAAIGDTAFFNADEAGSTKPVTNWEQASKAAQDLTIFSISIVPALFSALADLEDWYDPGSYIEVKIGNTRVYEQLLCYCLSGTGLVVNFSLAAAAAVTMSSLGEPTPTGLFKIPGGIKVRKGEAFNVTLHLFRAPAATVSLTMVLHCERGDITY